MTLRLTSSSFAGTLRKLVAVGTVRLRSMFAAIATPAPRIGSPASDPALAAGVGDAAGGADCAIATGDAGAGATGAGAAAGVADDVASPFPATSEWSSEKNSRQDSLTASGSSRNWAYISSTSHEFAPKS